MYRSRETKIDLHNCLNLLKKYHNELEIKMDRVIKIIVATHKNYIMHSNRELYLPVHVGSEGKEELGYQRDNEGKNISKLNPYYCELTGLYWAWKNLDCDYLGMVHYRRYFTDVKRSYKKDMDINEVVLSEKKIRELMSEYDVVVPSKRKYYIETLYSHYSHTHGHAHLDITREIIAKLFPDYLDSFDSVMRRRSGYMFNMFIMSKENVSRYCEWLFPILDSLYKTLDISEYSSFEARLFGRVSERLFNVWLAKEKLRIKEMPFLYMEKINKFEKGKSFLQAKFLGKKYGQSF